ncbi:MAG: hypothetical protein LBM99_06405 [Bacillales bacterium]|jgi:hypothetical protein|nr:hypothetical protein [Bacillales bacterium]
MKKYLLLLLVLLVGCKTTNSSSVGDSSTVTSAGDSSTVTSVTSSSTSSSVIEESSSAPEVVYGIPTPATGFYMKDADIIEESNKDRYLLYLTNAEAGEEDNVIAIRKGTFDAENGYAYSAEHLVLTPSSTGWDKNLSSASISKGDFNYAGNSYSYLLAYGGSVVADKAYSIGLAVANNPLGTWTRVGTEPVIKYEPAIYGSTYSGFYAPSLVNLSQTSIMRLFYTWADAYGHFTYFVDFDASDLSDIDIEGFVMVPTNGDLDSGDAVTMIPNADFAYDAESEEFYMIKDYSPAASKAPKVSIKIELAKISEEELYTTDIGEGWESLNVWIFLDTPNSDWERLYSGTIVSDEYGHLLTSEKIEVIYNISDLEQNTPSYIFTQRLVETFYEV